MGLIGTRNRLIALGFLIFFAGTFSRPVAFAVLDGGGKSSVAWGAPRNIACSRRDA
jgi:hypothetical protein